MQFKNKKIIFIRKKTGAHRDTQNNKNNSTVIANGHVYTIHITILSALKNTRCVRVIYACQCLSLLLCVSVFINRVLGDCIFSILLIFGFFLPLATYQSVHSSLSLFLYMNVCFRMCLAFC